jgi:hypothetical protein
MFIRRVVFFGVLSGSATLGSVALAAPAADPTATTPTAGSNTQTTVQTGYHPIPAMLILLGAGVVIVACLLFLSRYHRRLLLTIDRAIAVNAGKGVTQPLTTSEDSAFNTLLASTDDIKIKGPVAVVVGQEATFTLEGITDPTGIEWSVSGVDADPTSGTGLSFTTKFSATGTANVSVAGPSGTTTSTGVPVVATPPSPMGGIVLPFVLRNWGRLVVVIFGAALVGTLMVLNAITSEGGVGLLGALFGVGAATAHTDPNATPGSSTTQDDATQ